MEAYITLVCGLGSFYAAITTSVLYAKFYNLALIDTRNASNVDQERKEPKSVAEMTAEREREIADRKRSWVDDFGLMSMQPSIDRELKCGNPFLYGLTLIRMWGVAEAKVDDIAIEVLRAFPKILNRGEFTKLAGNLVEFSVMSKVQRVRHLYGLYKQKLEVAKKNGVGRFEAILDGMGLGGGVDEEVRRLFMEMSELRHNLVHRMAVADRKLVDRCPWLDLKEGQAYGITLEVINAYAHCLQFYVMEIDRRLHVHLDEPQPKSAVESRKFHLSRLKQHTTQKIVLAAPKNTHPGE
ncbi:MAG: hypothetical protein NVSMB9_34640 [Isosphaeraceae bacterium]